MAFQARFSLGASICAVAAANAASIPAQAQEGADALTDTIIVAGRPLPALEVEAEPVSGNASAADAAALVAHLPGAALINNGAVSGQVQYRGLFSERLAIRVGGQSFQSGGPNAMDPPLHYAPTILLDSISVSRGAAPVSQGLGLGGLVDARLKSVDFGSGDSLAPRVDVAASYRTVDQGIAVGGVAGLASDTYRVNAIASWEEGDDYRIPGGHVADSSYSRLTYGLSGGIRQGENTLTLDLRRQETGDSGNPPFPMDIEFFDTDFARLGFDGKIAGRPAMLALSYTGVKHGMNNYERRPPPTSPMQFRRTLADADTFNASARIGFGPLAIGMDGSYVDRSATITNPNNAAFFINSLDRVKESRFGGFAELSGQFGDWQGDLGVRVDRHHAKMADPLTGSAVPAMVQMLAAATAANNRARNNTTVDAVARIWREEGLVRPRLTLSRKTRVPNAVERFSWLPTGASGGLADGNIYIGDQALKPEVAWAAEAGVDLVGTAVTFRPSVFYRRIDNYIQGTPVPASMAVQIMIATMNGDATPLIFSNVDAELYGFDGDLSWQFMPGLQFDATVSYIRGKRRDIADDLYRIAPINGRASLTYGASNWSVTGEVVTAASQRKVSATNDEQTSSGWVVANLWFDWRLSGALRVSGGVENLFDRRYADHLSGINRVRDSDVALGERLPGVGRGGFLRLSVAY
ncbi:MAG: TonB-dependent receptor [Novosphingobium sp.]|nr:TonB-dependent receptor [Novosphingobium sp.]MCP5401667.1 TonB-dependent receptor [Novosphingobium sp.]